MRRKPYLTIFKYGKDILKSDGMKQEKGFIQHGKISVFEHSLKVALLCVAIANFLPGKTNRKSLVRGALLHDYFLYDWHVPDPNRAHKLHGFTHAAHAMKNADRDFQLNAVERNMINTHMFPLNFRVPKYRESVILCIADKISATEETITGVTEKLKKRIGKKK